MIVCGVHTGMLGFIRSPVYQKRSLNAGSPHRNLKKVVCGSGEILRKTYETEGFV